MATSGFLVILSSRYQLSAQGYSRYVYDLSLHFKMALMNADEAPKLLMETNSYDHDHDYYINLRSLNCQQIVCCIIWHGSIFCLQYNSIIFSTRILVQ